MLKDKKLVGLIVGLLLVSSLLVGVVVTSVQGKADNEVAVVNMEAVYTQYMAPPLLAARDEMQQEFDEKSADLTDEEKTELFQKYQDSLDELEYQFEKKIEVAIETVARNSEYAVLIDSEAVLYGGVDKTQAVLEVLEQEGE